MEVAATRAAARVRETDLFIRKPPGIRDYGIFRIPVESPRGVQWAFSQGKCPQTFVAALYTNPKNAIAKLIPV
jgi:hypothetical protein